MLVTDACAFFPQPCINLPLQVLEKKANHYKLDQYAAMMAVNGFRGYMNEFMNDVLPKHVSKESKTKKKKAKDDVSVFLFEYFTGVGFVSCGTTVP